MADLTPNYYFEGDEIFALHEGKVIASGNDMKQVESEAVAYLDGLRTHRDQVEKANAKKQATHVTTPSGLKGEILGRTPNMWGETVTVRFENGHIAHLNTHGEDGLTYSSERTASTNGNPAEKLEQRLASTYERDLDSLRARHRELGEIAKTAFSHLRNGAPYQIEVQLDQVRTAAETEARQIKEAIDHLEAADLESFTPPAPYQMGVAEQAGLGRQNDGSWLDVTTQDMIDESEGQDLGKLMVEGPAMFVTGLDDGALGNQGVVQEMAYSHVVSKTAGFTGSEVEQFRASFVARVEQLRRAELSDRKATHHKEAAAAEEVQSNAPDEALFM
jgi:hypothetical protein